jgi:hypothetical protein
MSDIYLIGEDIRFTLTTVDADGDAITLDHVDVTGRRLGAVADDFAYDETDTEITVASGLVTLVIPAATTALLAAGTYCVEWTGESSTGNIDKVCASFVLRGCCG